MQDPLYNPDQPYHDPTSKPLVPETSSLAKKIQMGYHFGIIIIAFINLIVGWITYSTMSAYTNSIMDFRTNWELKPIGTPNISLL